jgi:hypothetical protein
MPDKLIPSADVGASRAVIHRLPRPCRKCGIINTQHYPQPLTPFRGQRHAGPVPAGNITRSQQRRKQRLANFTNGALGLWQDRAARHRRCEHCLLELLCRADSASTSKSTTAEASPAGTATPLPEMSSRPDLALSPVRSLPQAPRAVPDLVAECHHLDIDHYATDGRSATRILPRQVPEGPPTTYPAAECTSSRCPVVTRGGIDRVISARCGDDARPRNHPVQDRLGRVARPAPHSTACRS